MDLKTHNISRLNSVQEGELSHEEELRRERMRLFTKGVSTYEWTASRSDERAGVVFPMNGMVIECLGTNEIRTVYDGSDGAAVDPHISPDSNWVAFVIDRDLFVMPMRPASDHKERSARPRRVTDATSFGVGASCGLADYIAQEEMDRYRGFWWSPDSKKIAYTVIDESMVPEYHILHQVLQSVYMHFNLERCCYLFPSFVRENRIHHTLKATGTRLQAR